MSLSYHVQMQIPALRASIIWLALAGSVKLEEELK
jgi:hypothetical protein